MSEDLTQKQIECPGCGRPAVAGREHRYCNWCGALLWVSMDDHWEPDHRS